MHRNLALELVRVTEAAALAAARLMGTGKKDAADQLAVTAMRKAFQRMDILGTVVIGEGERDEAPMLYIGEEVGGGGVNSPKVDIAVDPLEGTNLCAFGQPNALAVVAMGEEGNLLNAPDTYMEKIAVGPIAKDVIDIRKTATENLQAIAKVKDCSVDDLTAVVLERDRHQALIQEIRDAGARIRLISDGDVSAAIATCVDDAGIDVLFGTGGAPEGVLAACALKCLQGGFQGILRPRNDSEAKRCVEMGVELDKVLHIEDLAKGHVMFSATGVTSGDMLKGVRYTKTGAKTQSLVMRSRTKTVRFIDAIHVSDDKKFYQQND